MHKANAHIFPDLPDEKSPGSPVISGDSAETGDPVTVMSSYEEFTGPALPAEDESVAPEDESVAPEDESVAPEERTSPYPAPVRIRMNPFRTMTRSRIT